MFKSFISMISLKHKIQNLEDKIEGLKKCILEHYQYEFEMWLTKMTICKHEFTYFSTKDMDVCIHCLKGRKIKEEKFCSLKKKSGEINE